MEAMGEGGSHRGSLGGASVHTGGDERDYDVCHAGRGDADEPHCHGRDLRG
jgi:hypothetical protein